MAAMTAPAPPQRIGAAFVVRLPAATKCTLSANAPARTSTARQGSGVQTALLLRPRGFPSSLIDLSTNRLTQSWYCSTALLPPVLPLLLVSLCISSLRRNLRRLTLLPAVLCVQSGK